MLELVCRPIRTLVMDTKVAIAAEPKKTPKNLVMPVPIWLISENIL